LEKKIIQTALAGEAILNVTLTLASLAFPVIDELLPGAPAFGPSVVDKVDTKFVTAEKITLGILFILLQVSEPYETQRAKPFFTMQISLPKLCICSFQ
jgi:hypothetical protein